MQEIKDPSIIVWTSSPKPNFDGVDDYIEIPEINHLEGQIKFFCCPIDFHTILYILKALIKNWGRATIYIIKPTSEKWMSQGRSY